MEIRTPTCPHRDEFNQPVREPGATQQQLVGLHNRCRSAIVYSTEGPSGPTSSRAASEDYCHSELVRSITSSLLVPSLFLPSFFFLLPRYRQ